MREKRELFEACDEALRDVVAKLKPAYLIGVGKFAEDRIRAALPESEATIGRILHPSPASPVANRGWAPQAEKGLRALGIKL